jgi:WD40 repeat protein
MMFEDPLERSLKILHGHQDDVTGCSVIFTEQSPESVYVLSSSHDKTLRIWDLGSGECLHILRGHTGWVNGCAVDAKGRLAASASSDHTVILWDVEALLTSLSGPEEVTTGRESWHYTRLFLGEERGTEGCAFSPDGKYVLGSSPEVALQLWDTANGEVVRSFVHDKWVRCCTYSPDGKYILGGYSGGILILWDVQTGQPAQTFRGDERDVWGCAFSRDGKHILSAAGYDHTLRYWNRESGECVHVLAGHQDRVAACAISPDGKLGLSASDDWSLRLWDLKTGQCLQILEKKQSGDFRGLLQVNDCAFSPDGHYALSASKDQTVSLWNVEDGQLVRTYTGHSASVQGCAFSPDGRLLVSSSSDQSVRLWDVETTTCLCIFRGHTDTVYKCAFSPDGQSILSQSRDRSLRLWDISPYQGLPQLVGHQQAIRACRFSPDGKYVLSASDDHTLCLWDAATQRVLRIFTGHTEKINDCAFSPDGCSVLSASNDQTLRLWDLHEGTCKKVFTGHSGPVWGCAFSPDGQYVLSGGGDRRIARWEIATGNSSSLFTNLTRDWTRYTFTPDGRYILSTSTKYTLKLWDILQEKYVPSYQGVVGPPLSEEFQRNCTIFAATAGRNAVNTAISPNGDLALSVYPGKTFILWEIVTGQEIYRRQSPAGMNLNDPPFSPDGKYFLMKCSDNVLRLWHTGTGKEMASWITDVNILCRAFHPDGRQIVVGDENGALHFLLFNGLPIEEETLTGPTPQREKSSPVGLGTEDEEVSPIRSTPVKKTKLRFSKPFWKREKPSSDPIDEIPLTLRLQLMRWAEAFRTVPGGRDYLENHLELLREESEQFFALLLSKAAAVDEEDRSEYVEQMRITLDLLRDIRARGNTKKAVHDAFVNRFGVFIALDLPPWLEELCEQLGNGISTSETILLLRDAVKRAQQDASLQPEITSSVQMNLAKTLLQSGKEKAYAEAIALAEDALNVLTSTRFPRLFARVQEVLGSVLFQQASEAMPDRRKRYAQRAIKHFKSALSVLTPQEQRKEWCECHLKLAQVYEFKGAIGCAQLHLAKVLEVLSADKEPELYAMLQKMLDSISMAMAETDVWMVWLEQAFDSHMSETVRNMLDTMTGACDDDDDEVEVVYGEIEGNNGESTSDDEDKEQ